MKRVICLILAGLLCMGAASASNLSFKAQELPQNEAVLFAQRLGAGWNLGNTFDAFDDARIVAEPNMETLWVGYKTTEALLDAVKAAGFTTLRIPVSWHSHVNASLAINDKWLNRVQQVVDWALDRGFYVILNSHHDMVRGLCYPTNEDAAVSERYLRAVWSQIAERFADYDERLLFEGMNEPRLKDTRYEWNYDAHIAEYKEAAACINRMEQVFVDTVRAAGGENAHRYLLVTGYAGSPVKAAGVDMVLPGDTVPDRLMVEAHAYVPYDFALNIHGGAKFSASSRQQTSDVQSVIKDLYRRYVSKGIPVVLDEYGALNKNNPADRAECVAYVSRLAASYGIPCCIWDNGYEPCSDSGEAFGLFDRRTAALLHPEITEAAVQAWRTAE